jgi:hypothetical protein
MKWDDHDGTNFEERWQERESHPQPWYRSTAFATERQKRFYFWRGLIFFSFIIFLAFTEPGEDGAFSTGLLYFGLFGLAILLAIPLISHFRIRNSKKKF